MNIIPLAKGSMTSGLRKKCPAICWYSLRGTLMVSQEFTGFHPIEVQNLQGRNSLQRLWREKLALCALFPQINREFFFLGFAFPFLALVAPRGRCSCGVSKSHAAADHNLLSTKTAWRFWGTQNASVHG